jgi:hypothetical protein
LSTETPGQAPSLWCLVGNIVEDRPYGEGGLRTRRGTKHFAPGAKVYCLPTEWGDLCCENLMAIGRHRKSGRLVSLVVRKDWVTNWRAKVVYHPKVLCRIEEATMRNERGLPYLWTSKEVVEDYVAHLSKRAGQEQERTRRNSTPPPPPPAGPCSRCPTETARPLREERPDVWVWRCSGCGEVKRNCPLCRRGWVTRGLIQPGGPSIYVCDECEATWPGAEAIGAGGDPLLSFLVRYGMEHPWLEIVWTSDHEP